MEAVVEQLPQAGHLQITIQASADINYSAKAAQRIAGRFVADEAGWYTITASSGVHSIWAILICSFTS